MPQPLTTFIKNVLPSTHAWQITLLQEWESIVGNLKEYIRIEKIEDTVIVIGVINTAWMQEMHLLSEALLNRINKTLDYPRLKVVRFKYRPRKSPSRKKIHTCNKSTPLSFKPLAKEIKALEKIRDTSLRQAMEEFLKRCKTKGSYEICSCSSLSPTSSTLPF